MVTRPRTLRLPALLALVLALVVSMAPAAAAWEPTGGAIFNNPKGNKAAKYRIVNSNTRAVNGAPRGSTMLMSAYMFDNRGTYKAMMRAHRRGVHVQVVLDAAHARNGKTRRMAARFNGAYFVDDDLLLEPSGRRVHLSGVLVAQLRDDRIAVAHLYYDDVALLEQMLTNR